MATEKQKRIHIISAKSRASLLGPEIGDGRSHIKGARRNRSRRRQYWLGKGMCTVAQESIATKYVLHLFSEEEEGNKIYEQEVEEEGKESVGLIISSRWSLATSDDIYGSQRDR